MKILIITLASVLWLILPAGAQTKNDWSALQLKGKVKTLKLSETHRYKKAGVFTEWEKYYSQEWLFNSSGNKTGYSNYYGNGTLSYKTTYTNNTKDKTREEAFFDKDGKQTSKVIYILNDKELPKEQIHYKADGSVNNKYVFTYDDKGNLLERSGYKNDGSLMGKSTWKYDSKGNMTERKDAYSSSLSVYDSKGIKNEETTFKPDGSIMFRYQFKYDDKGNKTEESKYDDKGNLRDKNIWTYEYDKASNWTKRVQSDSDGQQFHTEERTIIYY
jgi:hypothetical protein